MFQFERVSDGVTYKSKAQGKDKEHTFYTTINHDDNNKVFEMFVRINDAELFEMIQLITINTSMFLQDGKDPMGIAKELQEVHSPTTNHMIPKTNIKCPSIIARIGMLLEQRIEELENEKEKILQ